MALKELLHSDAGGIVISIILGLGLAALFMKACSGPNCVVVKGPDPSEVAKYVYKIRDDCYKYDPYITPCADHAP